MKLAYRTMAILFSICPLLQADDTDIGKFGHVVSNITSHPVHVHLDISAGSDAEAVIAAGEAWKTGKTGKVNKWEVRDYESGMWVANVNPAEDGGKDQNLFAKDGGKYQILLAKDKYQVLFIEPGSNNGKFKGSKSFTRAEAQSRYKYKAEHLLDQF